MKFGFSFIISSLAAMSFASAALAAETNLYDQPKIDAKVVGSIDAVKGMVPIFTTKEGDWMKVGDPNNGNVGWVKTKDLSPNSGATSFSFTQKTIDNGKGPQRYQIIKFGPPAQMTNEQIQQMLQRMRMQQQVIQKSFQDMIKNMDTFYHQQWENFNFPMVVPVGLVPAKKAVAPQAVTPANNAPVGK